MRPSILLSISLALLLLLQASPLPTHSQSVPFTLVFSGTAPNTTGTVTHFSDPSVPNLVDPLLWVFTDQVPSAQCTYWLCARGLSQAPDDVSQWPSNCQRPYVNSNYVNASAGTAQKGSFYLPSGRLYFAVYSQPASPTPATVPCSFRLQVDGNRCNSSSQYGPYCQTLLNDIVIPSVNGSSWSVSMPATQPFPLIGVTPSSQTSAAIVVNVTLSNSDGSPASVGFTLVEREGNAPLVQLQVFDANITSYNANNNAIFNITLPSERHYYNEVIEPRYLLTVAPNASQPLQSTLRLVVNTQEYLCQSPYIGPSCLALPLSLRFGGPTNWVVYGRQFTSGSPVWLHFNIFIVEQRQKSFRIGVNVPDGYRAPNMYLRLGGVPTDQLYDVVIAPTTAVPNSVWYNSGETDVSGRPPWFVGLYYPAGYVDGGSDQTILLFNDAECPTADTIKGDCSGNGQCINHRCQCIEGWTDITCNTVVNVPLLGPVARVLLPLFTILGGIGLGVAIYYYFKRTPDSAFHMQMRGRGLLGHPESASSTSAVGQQPRRGGFGSSSSAPSQSSQAAAARPTVSSGAGPRGNIHSFAS